jgi:hypothetical protein
MEAGLAEIHVAHLMRWRTHLVRERRAVISDALGQDRIPAEATKELLRLQDLIDAVDDAIRDESGAPQYISSAAWSASMTR